MNRKLSLGVAASSLAVGLAVLAAGRLVSSAQSPGQSSNGDAASSRLSTAADAGFVAHEWGTFTSFQTGDGNLLAWRPLESSKLPKFVYNWQQPGAGRTASGLLLGGKTGMTSLQRMETPVIYFYSKDSPDVDVTVKFPEGNITEWYPQATQIGPAAVQAGAGPNALAVSSESMIRWSAVHVRSLYEDYLPALPIDDAGSHYYAARETDADQIWLGPGQPKDPSAVQTEKFLFYRGVGNFKTPLRVTMKSDDGVDIANTGNETLSHLFVLSIKDGAGRYVYVPELKPGEVKPVVISSAQPLAVAKFSGQLAAEVSTALAKTGLYPKEATAMANTWKDSWFTEPGVRVLYTLPRSWTDHTLPITLNPAPKELVRTMVGRAEVLPPGVEHDLTRLFRQIEQGDTQATNQAHAMLAGLGRFAQPTFDHILTAEKLEPKSGDPLYALTAPVVP